MPSVVNINKVLSAHCKNNPATQLVAGKWKKNINNYKAAARYKVAFFGVQKLPALIISHRWHRKRIGQVVSMITLLWPPLQWEKEVRQ